MKYMPMVYTDQKSWTDSEREHCYAESAQLRHELELRGEYVAANPLQPVTTATSVGVRNGKVVMNLIASIRMLWFGRRIRREERWGNRELG